MGLAMVTSKEEPQRAVNLISFIMSTRLALLITTRYAISAFIGNG
jgi:hypothetical protein